tara:strand:- start:64 stop:2730 length:2667 start_codon:yes stop_codon:yes gene_type:complete
VGIGTSEPTTTLQVNGTITSTALAVTDDVTLANNKKVIFGDPAENISGDGTRITIASSNSITLDATTDIILDADGEGGGGGGDIIFKDAGLEYGRVENNSGNIAIANKTSNTWYNIIEASGNNDLTMPGNVTVGGTIEAANFKQGGANFTDSLLIGHSTTGTLNNADNNTGVGVGTLNAITSADNNVAIGKDAGGSLTTGAQNVAIGRDAMLTASTNASYSTAIGYYSMRDGTGGFGNTGIGYHTLRDVTGRDNIAIGINSGRNITGGSGNIFIGTYLDADAVDSTRTLKIAGYDGTTRTSWILGDSSGAITFNSAYTFPTADGSAGQFLTTDGSGALSFATVSTNSISQLNSNVTVTDSGTGAITIAADGNTIITMNATTALDASAVTNAVRLPNGTTAQRPSGSLGMIRYNSSTDNIEGYTTSGGWAQLGATTSTTENTDDTATGSATAISTSAQIINQFTTDSFDSAFYLAVVRDEISDSISTAKYSVAQNDTSAVVATSHVVRQTASLADVSIDAEIGAGNMRLKATGSSVVNSISFYRIGLGDNTTAGTTGNVTTVINTDVDSTSESLDSFAHSSYRGAKYFISVNNTAKSEVSNVEALVVHNGSDAFINVYGTVNTGNNDLINLTAAIDGGNVVVSVIGNEPNLRVTAYRILLADSESGSSGDNVNIVGTTNVSSTATQIDSFNNETYTGAFYIFTGFNAGGGEASISEVSVVSNDDAYIATGPVVNSTGTDQLSFTATQSGANVSVKAASTSGASTAVSGYRVHMLRGNAGASTADTVLVSTTQTITGNKTFDKPLILNVNADPSTVTNSAHIYAKDESSSAEVFVRDEAGNVTKISPHNDEGEWEYYSRNTKTGKTVRVNMEEMIRDIEKLTGKTYIKNN